MHGVVVGLLRGLFLFADFLVVWIYNCLGCSLWCVVLFGLVILVAVFVVTVLNSCLLIVLVLAI